MSSFQIAAVSFTIAGPLLLWRLCRGEHAEHVTRQVRHGLAFALALFFLGDLAAECFTEPFRPNELLPMHLCDWALIAVAAAVWWRWQTGFELGYFWGLAGTLQALFTPAIDGTAAWWRLFGFFFAHALIIVTVLHLLITERMRPWPASLGRVFIWSEAFLVCALMTNTLTGSNFGFLAHRPSQPTLLDQFSDTHWLYVLQINLVGLAAFALLYLPWLIYDSLSRRRTTSATPPA
ncbi:MAG: conserved hypothetical integral rane protein [Chthoniobacter sp.]|jgi:hypothetical integral membrane protein (TIGR02206 family)|nr:conserved hypothetical integral rane protein [Chthoniobacter sp.]